ncbi:MAG: CehA/McbA family metallohydrolase [Gemmataceae bacterium]|nr:CehA/McbA family metallohydrolase [Gemmataceae bacterium]
MQRLTLSLLLLLGLQVVAAEPIPIELTFRDKATGQSVPCRVHLKDAAGKPVRAPGQPFWFDHFVCPGSVQLSLEPGKYTIEIERGPEYGRIADSVEIKANGKRRLTYELQRQVDLTREGWWSGELHVHRPVEAVALLMRAEDLHVAPVITWWNKQNLWAQKKLPEKALVRFEDNRFYHVMAGEDEREGGALLFFNLAKPLAITAAAREYPSPMKFVEAARLLNEDVWIDIEKPFWWDVALWLASGRMNSIGIANNHMCRDRMYESEAWGKPRLSERLPAPLGNGFWTQEIYYHVLNAGLRVPPSAGSASGVLPNPVGYNRVYVHLGPELTYETWWQGLRAGRSFVTNGPLLRVRANDKLPGHVFTGEQEVQVRLKASLTSTDPIRYVEIIKNGQVERKVRVDELAGTGSLGSLSFRESGWFLVRAIADNTKTFRFASTAPFHVEVGANQRISKASAQFFLDWTRERMARIKLADPAQRQEVLQHHLRAEKFWQDRVAKANAE